MKKLSLLILAFLIFSSAVFAEDAPLTKGEVIDKLSTTDFVKDKIGQLFNINVGYDPSKISRLQVMPTIGYVKVTPKQVSPFGHSVLLLTASVNDPKGIKNISAVKADLNEIGKYSNMSLVDTGLWGDLLADDGVFSLQSNINPQTMPGEKELPITAVNRKGWKAVGRTVVMVEDNRIVSISIMPEQIKIGGNNKVSLTAQAINPDEARNIRSAKADLSALGIDKELVLQNKAAGLFSSEFLVPSSITQGDKKIFVYLTDNKGSSNMRTIYLEVLP